VPHAAFARFATAHREIRAAALSAVESAMVLRMCKTTLDLRTAHRQGDAAPCGLEAIEAAMLAGDDLGGLDAATLEAACGAAMRIAESCAVELQRRAPAQYDAKPEASR